METYGHADPGLAGDLGCPAWLLAGTKLDQAPAELGGQQIGAIFPPEGTEGRPSIFTGLLLLIVRLSPGRIADEAGECDMQLSAS